MKHGTKVNKYMRQWFRVILQVN